MMNYDTWKLRSPDQERSCYDEPDDPCEHESYDADIITGSAMCKSCGREWQMSKEELEAEIKRAGERLWLNRPNRKRVKVMDDDIPF